MRVAAAGLCCLVFCTGASAAGYLGGSVARNAYDNISASDIDDGSFTSSSVEDTDLGFRVFAGSDVSKNFAFEVGYQDFGEAGIDATSDGSGFYAAGPVKATVEATGFDVGFLGKLPLSTAVSAHVRLGLLIWDADISLGDTTATFTASDDGNDPFLGLGGEIRFSRQVGGRAEYIRYKFDDDRVDSLVAALKISF